MIKSFGNSETEKIWNGKKSPKLPPEIHKRAFAKLLIIHSAESEEDLKITPGNKFEHLSGNLKDYCSIGINDQWRYCQMLWIEVWIGKGLSDFLQHTIFKFHVLGHKVKLFKAFQSSPIFFCLPAEFKSHGFCGLCCSVALC